MIKISDTAKSKLKEMLDEINEEKAFIRIYVAGGGCAGMKWNMIIDEQIDEGDQIEFDDTFKVMVDRKSLIYTEGLEIDYSDDLIKQGFIIGNPNMKGGCGCGASFSTEPKETSGCGDCSNA